MNKTKFMQTDKRWGGLGYPKNPCYIRGCGCGEVALANILIEMEQYKKYTPATIQPYCKQFAASNCDGTYWSGIPTMMKHYGLTDVKECATMPALWKELAKGDHVAILLMGSRNGGSKGVHWTSSGHFIAVVDYKYKNGEHYVYVKDSYSNSSLRNGWMTYSGNLKNDVLKVWSGKLNGKKTATTTIDAVASDGKLTVNGIGGKTTIMAMQKFFGTPQDGVISGQLKKLSQYYPSVRSVQYGKGGSACIKALQKWLALSDPDGYIGKNTTSAWQKKLRDMGYLAKNEKIDGIFGVKSMKAWQKFLNDHLGENASKTATKANKSSTTASPKTLADKILDACKAQAIWMAKAKYGDWSPCTLTHSKLWGTCVTFVACVLQRLGYLKSGQYIWHNGKGYGTGKVRGANDKMEVKYMGNKTLTSLKDKLKAGDIVLLDDNKSGVKGSGGHIFILTGKWTKSGNPYIWDQEPNEKCIKTQKPRTYSGSRKVLAVVRLKENVK